MEDKSESERMEEIREFFNTPEHLEGCRYCQKIDALEKQGKEPDRLFSLAAGMHHRMYLYLADDRLSDWRRKNGLKRWV